MKRTSRIGRRVSSPLCAAVVLFMPALTSASLAGADDGPGPFGVTAIAAADRADARVGALFGADRVGSLEGGHFCTASVGHSPNRNLVVTAAHCLNRDEDLGFVHGYRDGVAPYCVWTVKQRIMYDGGTQGGCQVAEVAMCVMLY